jgi:protein-disulfide isomerase
MDFPLESIHKSAFKAAEAARCAGEQGKFWEMHQRLFINQSSLDSWKVHAQAVRLDVAKFEGCLSAGKYAEAIRKDAAEGAKAGVTGTPLFFLAYTDPTSSKVKTVARLSGAQPFAAFKAQIDQLLAGPEKPEEKKTPEKTPK